MALQRVRSLATTKFTDENVANLYVPADGEMISIFVNGTYRGLRLGDGSTVGGLSLVNSGSELYEYIGGAPPEEEYAGGGDEQGDTSTPTTTPGVISYPTGMNAAENLSNYPGFTNAMYFNGSDDYLSRNFGSGGNTTTWTWSCWIKRSEIDEYFTTMQAAYSASPWFVAAIQSGNKLEFSATAGVTASWESSSLYTDTSSWYHLVYVADTTSKTTSMNGSSTDRIRVYANGQQVLMSGGSIPGEGVGIIMNTGVEHTIGGYALNKANGYMANLQFIDGQALEPTDLGQYMVDSNGNTTSAWVPKLYDGDYGTNGFLLDFSSLELDGSGDIIQVNDTAPKTDGQSPNNWTAN